MRLHAQYKSSNLKKEGENKLYNNIKGVGLLVFISIIWFMSGKICIKISFTGRLA